MPTPLIEILDQKAILTKTYNSIAIQFSNAFTDDDAEQLITEALKIPEMSFTANQILKLIEQFKNNIRINTIGETKDMITTILSLVYNTSIKNAVIIFTANKLNEQLQAIKKDNKKLQNEIEKLKEINK